jgi:hypothetical protein
MANEDPASNNVRFNEISKGLEYAVGSSWKSANAGGVTTGSVSFSGASTTFTPPTLTTTQRDALTATEGMLVYNTTTHKLNIRTVATWEVVTSA